MLPTVKPAVAVQDLRCEYASEPLGLDTVFPRLSWKLVSRSGKRGQKQTASRILVASSRERLAKNEGDLWDVTLNSDVSVHVVYAGVPLQAHSECHWKVRVWDHEGNPSEWSAAARFSLGPLTSADWTGEWLGMAAAAAKDCPWFRKTFTLADSCDSAFAHIASVGYHELYVNGEKVGDAVLAPSVSNLGKRVFYATYDIGPYLRPGSNAVGLWLSAGWAEYVPGDNWPGFDLPKFPLVKAQVELSVGSERSSVVSDSSWKCRQSSMQHVGGWEGTNFGGEHLDLREHQPGWALPELDDADWDQARVYPLEREISADTVPPNRRSETILAVSSSPVDSGTIFTMARVFTGFIEVHLRGAPGTTATIGLSMDAKKECQFNQQGLLTFGETGEGTFCNRFCYHGIQYVTIRGAEGEVSLDEVRGYRVGNDLTRVGFFECSNALLKQVYDVTLNTFVNLTTGGYFSDCAHREKLGYGGDGMTTLEVALGTYEMGPLYSKWTADWVDVQAPLGKLPNTAPVAGGGGSPSYGCFIITLPWQVYLTYGDTRILERTYSAMCAWLRYLDTHADENSLLLHFGGEWHFLGDWLSPAGEGGADGQLLYNNLHYLYAVRTLAKVACALGHEADSAALLQKAEAIKTAVNRRFFVPEAAMYLDRKQVNLVLPLIADAVPEEHQGAVLRNLEVAIELSGNLDTGLFGTYFLTKYLSENGRSDLLFKIATQTTYPSYGHILAAGYDTWPEDWKMTHRFGVSKVHGCLNGIGAWFQDALAGIRLDPAAPGFQHFQIAPQLVGDVTWVKGELTSMYGRIVSEWELSDQRFSLRLEVPVNSSATLHYPATDVATIYEGACEALHAEGLVFEGVRAGRCVFLLQSGTYAFTSDRAPEG